MVRVRACFRAPRLAGKHQVTESVVFGAWSGRRIGRDVVHRRREFFEAVRFNAESVLADEAVREIACRFGHGAECRWRLGPAHGCWHWDPDELWFPFVTG